MSMQVSLRRLLRPFGTSQIRLFSSPAVAAVTDDAAAVKKSTATRHTKSKEVIEPLTIHKAISKVKNSAWASFDETIEIAINTGLDPRKPNQSIKGIAALPFGTGKKVRVCVFASGAEAQDALAAGAEVVGGAEVVAQIQAGNINFDTVIATPEMMSLVGKLGKVNNFADPGPYSHKITHTGVHRAVGVGSKGVDAQPEDWNSHERSVKSSARSEGRCSEVQGREEGHHHGWHR